MLQVGLLFLLKIPIVDLKLAQSLANSVIFTLSASDGARRRAARFDAGTYTGHSPGPHCHSTLALGAIGCHHGGICTRIVAPLLPFSAKMTVLLLLWVGPGSQTPATAESASSRTAKRGLRARFRPPENVILAQKIFLIGVHGSEYFWGPEGSPRGSESRGGGGAGGGRAGRGPRTAAPRRRAPRPTPRPAHVSVAGSAQKVPVGPIFGLCTNPYSRPKIGPIVFWPIL